MDSRVSRSFSYRLAFFFFQKFRGTSGGKMYVKDKGAGVSPLPA